MQGGGKKKLIAIAADIALVGVSMLSFDAGKKIGKKLTGRDEEQQTVQNIPQGIDYNS